MVSMASISQDYAVERRIRRDSTEVDQFYTEDQLTTKYGIPPDSTPTRRKIARNLKAELFCSYQRVWNFFTTLIPLLNWLPQYQVKVNLLGDVVAGFTVAVVHLPQGIAYGLLASLPPVHGLYVSFFPVLMYAVMGTIRQVSIGTFAVVCIMIGEVVDENVKESDFCVPSLTNGATNATATEVPYFTTNQPGNPCENLYLERKIEISVALCIAVGLIQVAFYFLRLGIITTYLSSHLVSGFTCGSAFHVLTSQVSKLFGISVKKYSGPLSLIWTYVDIFSNLTDTNWATVILSVICIVVLVIGKEINSYFHDKIRIPIPWEFGVVIFSTIASYYGRLNENHDVDVVGDIPTGLRVSVPKGYDIGSVIVEAIPIAVVAYAIEISLGKMFAVKHSYDIDSNQELMALGTANIFSSFFCCFPCAASLSRSIVWDEVGGKTQVTGMVSSVFILVVLLWLGPLFETLPQAALASIIVVNLKGMLRQFERIKSLWRINKLDAVIWMITWLSVFLLGVDIGLLVGVTFELITVVIATQLMNGYVLAEVKDTGIFKNVKKFHTSYQDEKENILIFSFPAPLYFANHERFTNQLAEALGFDPFREFTAAKQTIGKRKLSENNTLKFGSNNVAFTVEGSDFSGTSGNDCDVTVISMGGSIKDGGDKFSIKDDALRSQSIRRDFEITHLILDMAACSFIDNDGVKAIKEIFRTLTALGVEVVLASCNERISKSLHNGSDTIKPPYFLSLRKAISYARGEVLLKFDEAGLVREDVHMQKCGTLF